MLLQSINLLCTLHKIQIGWLCMHAYFTFSTLLKKWIECWKGCFAVWSIQILGAINLEAYDLLFFAHNKLSLSWWKGWLHLLQFRSQYLDKGASGCAGKGVRAGSNEAGRISSFLSSCWSWNPRLVLWHRFSSQDNWVRWFSAEGWLYFKGFWCVPWSFLLGWSSGLTNREKARAGYRCDLGGTARGCAPIAWPERCHQGSSQEKEGRAALSPG